MLMQKQQQQQQRHLLLQQESIDSSGEDSASGVGDEEVKESDGSSTVSDRPGASLPALAVAAVNACDSPSFLNAKARLMAETRSGALARVKKLMPLVPITVPQRAIGGDYGTSPSSGSPTPTDFSPLLLPKAEENLTALISEHNQQKRQLQIQQLQELQMYQQQIIRSQQHSVQVQLQNAETVPEQPLSKRPRLSNRGRKRHSDSTSPTTQVDIGALATFGTLVAGHVPQRRSSLGSTLVSVDPEEAPSDATAMRKGPWLAAEDEKLIQLVEKYGAHDWSFIAEHIRGRVGKQCRERYFNHLAPDVRKEAWTDREDDAIVHAHHVVGNKWTNIAKILGNGRSPNSIKNRWHSSLKNRLGEHGGEMAVMEATGAATGCHCDCKHCDCSCKVACVAFRCSCCFASHHSSVSESADDAQTNSASNPSDDDSAAFVNTPGGTASSASSESSKKK